MKVCFLGATGFVGSRMTRHFLEAGHEVSAVVRGNNAKSRLPKDVVPLSGQIMDLESLKRGFEGSDVVVNLVGIIRETKSAGFLDIHARGAENVVEAAKSAGVGRVLHMSAAGTRADAPSQYHRTKWMGEEAVRRSGLNWCILRPSLIFGSGDGFTTLLMDLISKPAPFIPVLGGGRNLLQPVSVDDVSRCFVAAAEGGHDGLELEIGGPDRLTFRQIVGLVAKAMESKKPLANIPIAMVRPVASVMSKIASGFPITPDQIIMLGEDNIAEPNHAAERFKLDLEVYEQSLPRIVEAWRRKV